MKSVYIETTIPSYLVSRSSRDLIIAGHQRITQDWWENSLQNYECFISRIMINEILNGEELYAQKRLELIKNIPLLDYDDEIEHIASIYMNHFNFPEKLVRDMYHLAYSVFHEIDFLLTWNCRHLANANMRYNITRLNYELGYKTPDICTPEELTNLEEE